MSMTDPIVVWLFANAPPELRALSTNGGDEDWLAVLPSGYERPAWMIGPEFGCCCVDEYQHPHMPGWRVFIGCHA